MAQTVRSRIESAQRRLGEAGQGHLTRFIRELSQPEQVALLEEIEGLDLELIGKLIDECVLQEPQLSSREGICPAQAYAVEPGEDQGAHIQRAMARGEQLIAEHKVAAFTVAGGVGTRLDFEGPKGDVLATPLRNKSLFQVFAEGIQAVQRKFNCVVPWYVMTSESNHEATLKSFEQYDYFGLDREHVMHFPQGMMPCFDKGGKILLSGPGHLAMSPDGHGGSLRALYSSGALGVMAKRGIEYISYFQVDNPLANILDP
ncbi:MAG: UTP--glucose-1-phosphate uridylyltransferase, partial [Planctomycetes bacterium]|nr:UTP--glucose-1-phosphate uridylyltransferase [Planctomycetota bacterium]